MTEPVPIDPAWRKTVVALLRAQSSQSIKWEPTGEKRFQADYPDKWRYDAYDAFIAYLESADPRGYEVQMDHPQGTTWEFLFPFDGKSAYGKILLTPDGKKLVIFSAHRPLREKL